MIITQAKETDFPDVRSFYHTVIDRMQGSLYDIGWKKDIYPEPEFLLDSIKKGELYICLEADTIAAAMVLNHQYQEAYRSVRWQTDADESGILVLHILGVHPENSGKGYGKAMIKEAVRIAGSQGLLAIRLDVLPGNLPAEKLYTQTGFTFIDSRNVYYEDVGWAKMDLYEYVL